MPDRREDKKPSEMPRRNWAEAVGRDAGANAHLAFARAGFRDPTLLLRWEEIAGADVARIAFLTPQTVGVIIRNLEQAGAIRKTPHPVHGRVLQWTLTRRGSAVLVKCRSRVRALERRLAQRLSPRGEATVRRWLADVAADLTDKN